jgi:hypothetical protein
LLERIEIEPTNTTLGVLFDPSSRQMFLKGVSYPSNPITFFQPLIDAVEIYVSLEDRHVFTVNFHISYFNTSSSTYLYRLMELFEKLNRKFKNVKVIWYYEDEDDDVLDAWKSITSDIDLSIKMVKIKE